MVNELEYYTGIASHHKEVLDECTGKICEVLTDTAPSDNEWYFRDGFFRVDVVKEDYDDYITFIEDLVGCSYCHLMNNDGLTFMVSLSTLSYKIL